MDKDGVRESVEPSCVSPRRDEPPWVESPGRTLPESSEAPPRSGSERDLGFKLGCSALDMVAVGATVLETCGAERYIEGFESQPVFKMIVSAWIFIYR